MNQQESNNQPTQESFAEPDPMMNMSSPLPANLKAHAYYDQYGTTIYWAEDPDRPGVALSICVARTGYKKVENR